MLKTADKGARLGNFIIDIFIILIFYVTIILVFVVVFSDFTNNHVPELEFLFLVIYLLYFS